MKDLAKKEACNEKLLTLGLIAVILLWRIPFLNKGIDYTDTGFSLTNYQEVFGGTGIKSIGLFLTNLLGGAIYKMLPCGQLLVFRVLHWLFGVATLGVAYCIFRPYLSRNLLLATLFAVFAGSTSGEALFNYYALTSVLLMLAILLLRDGLVQDKQWLIFASGLVTGVNIFVRLPNLLFVIIGSAIFLYGKWVWHDTKKILSAFGAFLLGVFLGFAFDLALMTIFLSPSEMIDSFLRYFFLAFGRSSSATPNFLGVEEMTDAHSLRILICVLGMQIVRALPWGLTVVMLSVACFVVWRKFISDKVFRHSFWHLLTGVIIVCVCLVGMILFWRIGGRNIISLTYLVALTSSLFWFCYCGKREPELSGLCALALLLAPCAILGSDLGVFRLGLMQFYLVPMLVLPLGNWQKWSEARKTVSVRTKVVLHWLQQTLVVILLPSLFLYYLGNLPKTYMDADYCRLKSSVVDTTGILAGMRTSRRRALQLEEYQQVMESAALQGRTVAIFGYFPLGNVLGKQAKYFTAPCIDYPSIKVRTLLHQISMHQEQGDEMPVVVISFINQIQRKDSHYTSLAKLAVIDYMLGLAPYEIFHSSENFLVYAPSGKRIE